MLRDHANQPAEKSWCSTLAARQELSCSNHCWKKVSGCKAVVFLLKARRIVFMRKAGYTADVFAYDEGEVTNTGYTADVFLRWLLTVQNEAYMVWTDYAIREICCAVNCQLQTCGEGHIVRPLNAAFSFKTQTFLRRPYMETSSKNA